MFPLTSLSLDQIELCLKTVSSNTFYMLVGDALVNGRQLSVVRMGDGEVELIREFRHEDAQGQVTNRGEEWLRRLGCWGITRAELIKRLDAAANEATYFAPSVSGIQSEKFHLHSLFDPREEYVDNFWCNAWTEEMKIQLFKQAQRVLFIHRNTASADAMQIRAKYGLDVKVIYLKLNGWEDAEDVIAKAADIDAPLVLFSAGPASKYIGPRIAAQKLPNGNHKVTLDLGNAADYWLLSSLKEIPAGRR